MQRFIPYNQTHSSIIRKKSISNSTFKATWMKKSKNLTEIMIIVKIFVKITHQMILNPYLRAKMLILKELYMIYPKHTQANKIVRFSIILHPHLMHYHRLWNEDKYFLKFKKSLKKASTTEFTLLNLKIQ